MHLARLRAAWLLACVVEVAEADGRIVPTETRLRLIAERDAAALGIVDEQGRTSEDFDELVAEAWQRLPTLLQEDAKLELLEQLVEVAAADMRLQDDEEAALRSIALRLGLDEGAVARSVGGAPPGD